MKKKNELIEYKWDKTCKNSKELMMFWMVYQIYNGIWWFEESERSDNNRLLIALTIQCSNMLKRSIDHWLIWFDFEDIPTCKKDNNHAMIVHLGFE